VTQFLWPSILGQMQCEERLSQLLAAVDKHLELFEQDRVIRPGLQPLRDAAKKARKA